MQSQDIFKIINNRRSIRKFTEKPISKEVLKKILVAGQRAPFAFQGWSVVYTRKPEKMKLKIGVYPTTKVLMFFLLDLNIVEKIINQRGYDYDAEDANTMWLAIQDATLASENVILAAEAMGLGSVLLGATPKRYEEIREVFNLPTRVFPIVGLCLGYPDPEALMEVRPRYPLKYMAFEDEYKDPSEDEIKECMKAMDEGYITQGYYIKNKAKIPLDEKFGEDKYGYDKYSWSEHICRKLIHGIRGPLIIEQLKKAGFKL
ncbi:MAG: nitroreductase family protein [Candidatus Hodarchaeales archaeon]|jgi:nitroreductase